LVDIRATKVKKIKIRFFPWSKRRRWKKPSNKSSR